MNYIYKLSTTSIILVYLLGSCSSYNSNEYINENVKTSSKITQNIDSSLGESIAKNEYEYTKKIEKDFLDTLKKQTTESLTRRAVHGKHHGIVKATFKVDNSLLDTKDRVGIFSDNKEYKCWIRFSNGNGLPKSDSEPDVRGMAIKLMGVSGKKILEDEIDAQTQDFLMINTKSFFIHDLDSYVDFVAASKDGLKGIAKFALLHPKTSYNIYKIMNQNISNPLETAFYSTTSYKLGNSAIKFGARPCLGENLSKNTNKSTNFLKEAMVKTLNQKDVCYDFMVQIRKGSLENMPVEDATKEWSEKESPYIKVATINIPKQIFDTPKQNDFAENISYTPWHSLPEHKPLGFTNRVRKVVYNTISKYRHSQNGKASKEPIDFNIN